MTAPRDEVKRAFLAREGWGAAALRPLAGDASNRRYERVEAGRRRAVLMDAPAERGEDIGRFLAFTGHLRDLGLSAPEIYGADIQAGFALIEDLGDALFARVAAAEPLIEREIYAAAVDLLPRLAAPPAAVTGAGARADVPPYDLAALTREAALAPAWWAKGAGSAFSADLDAEYRALIAAACAPVADARGALALRDYHAENLIWLPERRGDARVGLLDYQDALAGAPAYDLVSLLEDARRDTSPDLREAMIRRRLAATGEDEAAFRAGYAALGAQRNLKIIGIFARLWLRDAKPGYLALIPRVWAHLSRDLAHPALAPLGGFVRRHLPAPDAAALARIRSARA
ncbi:aminoglycoside phosphotransferase family protein [Pikeienuella sp. HZG-20]|uniref:aminoglycoside phosphotransferase family protein n=1 Tax=Paludibacillus litoralis TaxID=3133267 RepID=UPI0030EE9467